VLRTVLDRFAVALRAVLDRFAVKRLKDNNQTFDRPTGRVQEEQQWQQR
jgi:hypothetical protein